MPTIEQEIFDKVIADLKETHTTALQHAVKMAEIGMRNNERNCEEKLQELNKQNDGLLGAVGRLQGEKTRLEEKFKDFEAQLQAINQEHRLRAIEEEHIRKEIEIKHKNEIFELNKTIEKLKAKKARK